jgi:hypothetical protein
MDRKALVRQEVCATYLTFVDQKKHFLVRMSIRRIRETWDMALRKCERLSTFSQPEIEVLDQRLEVLAVRLEFQEVPKLLTEGPSRSAHTKLLEDPLPLESSSLGTRNVSFRSLLEQVIQQCGYRNKPPILFRQATHERVEARIDAAMLLKSARKMGVHHTRSTLLLKSVLIFFRDARIETLNTAAFGTCEPVVHERPIVVVIWHPWTDL